MIPLVKASSKPNRKRWRGPTLTLMLICRWGKIFPIGIFHLLYWEILQNAIAYQKISDLKNLRSIITIIISFIILLHWATVQPPLGMEKRFLYRKFSLKIKIRQLKMSLSTKLTIWNSEGINQKPSKKAGPLGSLGVPLSRQGHPTEQLFIAQNRSKLIQAINIIFGTKLENKLPSARCTPDWECFQI